MDYSLKKCPRCHHMSLRAVDNTEFYAVSACRTKVLNRISKGYQCALCSYNTIRTSII